MLNIMEYSTLGQSNIAVVLMTVGKTFQFVAMQIIRTPVKFKSMIYVGAFLGHINCLQVALISNHHSSTHFWIHFQCFYGLFICQGALT